MSGYYFISREYSTSYFAGKSGNRIDKEYEISNDIKVYYSTNKQKCIDWILKKRAELEEYAKKLNDRLSDSKIEIMEDSE